MALVPVLQYTLPFSTTTGQSIRYKLDILRTYNDQNPDGTTRTNAEIVAFYDWITLVGGNLDFPDVTPLVCTSNPIEIEWERDYDVYKPIIGSKAKLNLEVQNAGQYADFNAAGPFEYQVRLTYAGTTQQYTTTFTSPNTTLTPAITLPTGSQGTQFSLTEADGTLHRFGYITNGNYRYLDAGLTGIVRKGTAQAATTATASGSFTIADQGTNQTLSLAGDETGTFAAGDFISRSTLTAQAFRGLFIESAVFDGTNTVLTGTGGGGTTFDTTHTIYRAGPANEIQGEGSEEDYWRGYMTPLDGVEAVTTFPFEVSYTATDGLGLLEQSTAPLPTATTAVTAWSSVAEAIRQTGLDLDIYVDTKIQTSSTLPVTVANGSEAIDQITVNPEWVYSDRDKSGRSTRKEQIEDVLSAVNSTVKQSNGRWYVTNASTHGGTGDTESNTFEVYNVVTSGTPPSSVYVKNAASATETLRYNINSSTTSQLVPANGDLVLNTRRPYGSIECKPSGLYSQDVENGGFEVVNEDATSSPVGYTEGISGGPLRTSDTIRQNGFRSIFTPNNVGVIDSANDVWFTNTNGVSVDGSAPIEVSFDMLVSEQVADTIETVGFAYQITFIPDTPFTIGIKTGFDTLVRTSLTDVSVTSLVYNVNNEEWDVIASFDNEDYFFTNRIVIEDDVDAWLSETQMLPKPSVYNLTTNQIKSPGPGKVYIRTFFPRSRASNGGIDAPSSTILNFYMDNLSIRNMFSNDVTDPTFERVQPDYTSTYTYEPGIASSTSSALVQTTNQKQFIRTGNTEDADATNNRSLEEIGTQQKLNDFRAQFKYYEGNLVNLSNVPLAPHNKVYINWNNYTETESCIINGGRFKVKDNKFDVAMYVPSQATDIASGNGTINADGSTTPGFFTENVDLIPMAFPGLSKKRTYTLNVVPTTTLNGVETTDGLVPVQSSYEWTDIPGARIPVEFALEPLSPNRAVVSASTPTTGTPEPEHLSNITYSNNGIQLRVNAILTMPEDSELENLNINAQITDATPEYKYLL